ncbi:MAG: hypothetical protein COW00_14415 [Bdellovibrio sp. CG12_big_fil_rev_8_21_14_0_65_39_13]|nr:MAG: hypothetical protein COW78_07840 [Bdellovibrio sp. CG22_combo_CG10-13_8_21_14_all_39_27]PIQ58807.1 MAG: hypothetical protein COW00_14415 [Bdellovibrio sp. CG12_big_fil_rev_8_21_14_0_65_39_13]PIR35512.1 MAG: hypothetical protein COV37_08535 [Bdellovibrio sp. CG11_big_fil_rev_8_21_14_0_20_39_38]PJB54355.1 MAG: hypothetical protein CO099_02070 [Bdellovibrio sp. CG_4_9_14_3_um_filter_39_7]
MSKFSDLELKILIVEDMENFIKQMVNDLKKLQIKGSINYAMSIKKGIGLIDTQDYDFIISDWNLPDGTGMDVLKHVRQKKNYAKTPFLMCTTMDEVENILTAITAGATEYIVKPWEFEELKTKLSTCLLKKP